MHLPRHQKPLKDYLNIVVRVLCDVLELVHCYVWAFYRERYMFYMASTDRRQCCDMDQNDTVALSGQQTLVDLHAK